MKVTLCAIIRSPPCLVIALFLCATAGFAGVPMPQASVSIIEGRASHAVIIPGQDSLKVSLQASRELQQALQQATSVTVPILKNSSASVPAGDIKIFVGSGKEAREHGVNEKNLAPEEFKIKITPEYIVLVGHDIKATGNSAVSVRESRATQWAVDYLLNRYVGVRWLWPGPLGTYVPQHEAIQFPVMDITHQPSMNMRILAARIKGSPKQNDTPVLDSQGYKKLQAEVDLWKARHELGSRANLRFGSAFTKWWAKYHSRHPDYFAKPLSGIFQPSPRPTMVKLRIGNPAVSNQIISDWKAAGSPDNWDVCPNDGAGFDTSKASRAMDWPSGQPLMSIWHGKANLTIRYLKFWNALLARMRKINPNVTLSTYSYSAYRDLPKPFPIRKGLMVEFVNGYGTQARKQWLLWSDSGATLYLRPNWWHVGGPAPVLPLHEAGDYFKFAMAHGMKGFYFDRIMGYWATQGPFYYLIARLSERPNLTVDEVIDEYASAFGHAAPAIKSYLQYWENFTTSVGYSVPAGGAVQEDQKGGFERVVKAEHVTSNPTVGSFRSIPYIYTDKVIAGAEKILDHADVLAARDNSKVKARIVFLRSGLEYLQVVRDAMTSCAKLSGASSSRKGGRSILKMRRRLTKEGVIWGDVAAKNFARLSGIH